MSEKARKPDGEMPEHGVIFWDFDGTLGERPGGWSGLLVETLDAEVPGHGFSTETFRPFLRDGFPWHAWETPHRDDGQTRPFAADLYQAADFILRATTGQL